MSSNLTVKKIQKVRLTRALFTELMSFLNVFVCGASQLMNSCVLYASSGHFLRLGSGGSLQVPICERLK